MGLLDSVKGLPILVLVAFILILVANLFNGIAFSTTAWGETYQYITGTTVIDPSVANSYGNIGLWRTCTGSVVAYAQDSFGNCFYTGLGTPLGWLAATQTMAVFGFAGILGALILMFAYLLGSKKKDYLLLAAIICLVTGVLYLIGIIIFGVRFPRRPIPANTGQSLSWSFGLAVVSVLLEIVAGVLLLVGGMSSSTSPA